MNGMAAPPKYPLEALARVRDGAASRAEKELARETALRAERDESLRAVEAERARHAGGVAEVVAHEVVELEKGRLRVRDLSDLAAFEARADAEAAALDAKAEECRVRVAEAEAAVQARLSQLAKAKAEAKVVAEHEAKWQRSADKKAEEKLEAEAEDAHRGRRP